MILLMSILPELRKKLVAKPISIKTGKAAVAGTINQARAHPLSDRKLPQSKGLLPKRSAKVSKSNLYNYFANKDALFAAVVAPTLSEIQTGFEKMKSRNETGQTKTYTLDAQKEIIQKIVGFVLSHEEDLKLLLFRSSGSSFSDFKGHVIEALSQILLDWLSHAAPDKKISMFLTRSVAGFYIGVLEQMLIQDVSEEDVERHFEEFLNFVSGGWKAVLS